MKLKLYTKLLLLAVNFGPQNVGTLMTVSLSFMPRQGRLVKPPTWFERSKKALLTAPPPYHEGNGQISQLRRQKNGG